MISSETLGNFTQEVLEAITFIHRELARLVKLYFAFLYLFSLPT